MSTCDLQILFQPSLTLQSSSGFEPPILAIEGQFCT